MMKKREISLLLRATPTLEGAGVRLHRAFGFSEVPKLDPFLMLDDFRSDSPADYEKGFPWHPHRGIETITYLLKGYVDHRDSMGNAGTISPGDVQWMTAGSGIVHQEMPRGDTEGAMHGFQLWANLPASHKMMPPRYRGVTAATIPEVTFADGVRMRVIAGEIGGTRGPVDDIVTDAVYLDCTVPPGKTFVHETHPDYTAFIYVIGGRGTTDGTGIENRTLVLYGPGEELAVESHEDPLRFLILSGNPLHEPVAWRGPIVMNKQSELDAAFREYRDGTFIRDAR